VPELSADIRARALAVLEGPRFAGARGLVLPLLPSAAPGSPGFHARSYWRGPTWPFFNWLIWWSMRQHGLEEPARRLRAATLELLERPDAAFAEYFDPFTAEPLGSREQSWTAAVTLDWLAADASR
jgi:glycogen debranching enzyme